MLGEVATSCELVFFFGSKLFLGITVFFSDVMSSMGAVVIVIQDKVKRKFHLQRLTSHWLKRHLKHINFLT